MIDLEALIADEPWVAWDLCEERGWSWPHHADYPRIRAEWGKRTYRWWPPVARHARLVDRFTRSRYFRGTAAGNDMTFVGPHPVQIMLHGVIKRDVQ